MSDDSSSGFSANNKILIEAITAQMEKMMETKLKPIREQLKGKEKASGEQVVISEGEHSQRPKEPRKDPVDNNAQEFYSSRGHSSHRSSRRPRRARDERDLMIENLGGYKMKILPFHGRNDPDAYLDWEKKIELVFNCHHYADINRVKVVVTEFYDYALNWWEQFETSRRRSGEYPIETWAALKLLMRRRELHSKLRKLT